MITAEYNFNDQFGLYRFSHITKWLQCNIAATTMRFDCDKSKLAMDTYKECYDFLYSGKVQEQYSSFQDFKSKLNPNDLNYEIEVNGTIYTGDTLNSFATPFNHFCNEFLKEKGISIYKINYNDLLTKHYGLFNDESAFPYLKALDVFAHLTHTVGNFFPVSLYFNVERAGKNGKYEFPDIMLQDICNFYFAKSDEKCLNIWSSNKPERFDKVKSWLNLFGAGEKGWQNFIRTYKLEMYLNKEFKPINLWENHSIAETALPCLGKPFINYIYFVCSCIKQRGLEICAMKYVQK